MQAAWLGIETRTRTAIDRELREGDVIEIGGAALQSSHIGSGGPDQSGGSGGKPARFEVLHTPGHTQGSVSLWIPVENKVIAGDTLFRDSIGRTDLPGGNTRQILSSIKHKLLTLPENAIVIPGHGQNTTLGREKERNPFLQTL